MPLMRHTTRIFRVSNEAFFPSLFQSPVSREDEKTVCCCLTPWNSGQVSMYVSTDRRGYCPGESVAMDAFFSNQSTRRVRPEAALHQTQVQYTMIIRRVRCQSYFSSNFMQCWLPVPVA